MELDEKRLLRNTRMLTGQDILTILSSTPREFGRNTRFVPHQDALVTHTGLRLGESMLLGLVSTDCNHLVAMHRCPDGHYIFYDSLDRPLHPALSEYWERSGVSQLYVKMVCLQTQNEWCNTCSYHCLTFLEFVTSLKESNAYRVIMKFRRYIKGRSDVKAVLTVERIIKECGVKPNISVYNKNVACSLWNVDYGRRPD